VLSMGVRYWARQSGWALYSGIQVLIGLLVVVLTEILPSRLSVVWYVIGFGVIAAGLATLMIPWVFPKRSRV
jgi:hypothetical protein